MSRDILHFSHANGFPAACYRKFFSYLEPDFRISSINCIGHDPGYPVTDGWPHLVAQLIDHLAYGGSFHGLCSCASTGPIGRAGQKDYGPFYETFTNLK